MGKIKDLIIIAGATILITFFIWLPHVLALPNFWGLNFSEGFNIIYRNFDGLEYVVIARSLYDPVIVDQLSIGLPSSYFASHFPGYSLVMTFFAPILGYLKSMLFVSLLSTIFSAWGFYFLIKDFKLTNHPLFLSLLFLILPARWLIVHSVGSSEPLFIFFIILAVYLFMKFEQSQKYYFLILAGLVGAGAQLTRPPGILLFIALALFIHFQLFARKISFSKYLRYFPLLLIPFTLLGIFYLYYINLNDFWAYFHSGDNIHLTFPPFQVFNINQFWVGDIWLEDLIYIFILGFFGGVLLLKQKLYPLAFFVLTYLGISTFVAHRDISRYILPIFPFILIAYEKVLTSKEFKIILPIILIAIYLYAQNFILANSAPIPNLGIFD